MTNFDTIVLITGSFPWGGRTEPSFVMPEIEALSRRCRRLVVMPAIEPEPDAQHDFKLPENAEVSRWWIDSADWRMKWRRVRYMFSPRMVRLLCADSRYRSVTFAAAAFAFSRSILKFIRTQGIDVHNTLFYSFWFEFPAAGLALASEKTPLRFISRAHGHDIYTTIALPIKKQTVARSLGLYAASCHGRDFIRGIMPELADKIHARILGSVKLYGDKLSSYHSAADKSITVLSVARVDHPKRVHLNFDMLKALAVARPTMRIRWIHVGDGSQMPMLRERIASGVPENLEVELRGAMSNSEVQRIYVTETVDWSMLLSASEGGNPVAICESLSYGVPVIATEAGGITESVTDECALLLSVEPTEEEFVRGMLPYIDSDVRMESMREVAIRRWKECFCASELRERFIDEITALCL